MPEGRAERAVEAERRALTAAEHSATLEDVMAGQRASGQTLPTSRPAARARSTLGVGPDPCAQ